ncbi:maspardin-like [Sarcoptes scabiei]|nr:maspardin-like [Sarcoptes scabiei]
MKIFIANFSIIFVSLLVIDAKQIANVPNDLKSNHQHQHQQQQQHKDSKQTEKSKDGKIDTAKYFLWKDCGSSSVIVDSIELRPLPLTLKKTDLIYTTVHANITKQFPNDAIMSVEVNKTISFLGKQYNVRLPCLKDLGSCRIPMNKIFDTWYGEWLCPMFRLSHKFCYLPILPGEYSLKNFDVPVPFKKFKNIIATIASGDYSINVKIANNEDKSIFCLNIKAKLV